MNRKFFLVLLLALVAWSLSAQTVRKVENIRYIDSTDPYAQERCVLDVIYPEGARDLPVVVWFHGGGLTGGDKQWTPAALLDGSFVVVRANYRLIPKVHVQVCIEDAVDTVLKSKPLTASGDAIILDECAAWYNLAADVIAQEIGEQPVLSFGNSTGDASMAEYTTSNNPYKSLAFMLCCDDTERENGNAEKADKMYSLCEEFDWVPISMKNDWTTIYGDGVTKTASE